MAPPFILYGELERYDDEEGVNIKTIVVDQIQAPIKEVLRNKSVKYVDMQAGFDKVRVICGSGEFVEEVNIDEVKESHDLNAFHGEKNIYLHMGEKQFYIGLVDDTLCLLPISHTLSGIVHYMFVRDAATRTGYYKRGIDESPLCALIPLFKMAGNEKKREAVLQAVLAKELSPIHCQNTFPEKAPRREPLLTPTFLQRHRRETVYVSHLHIGPNLHEEPWITWKNDCREVILPTHVLVFYCDANNGDVQGTGMSHCPDHPIHRATHNAVLELVQAGESRPARMVFQQPDHITICAVHVSSALEDCIAGDAVGIARRLEKDLKPDHLLYRLNKHGYIQDFGTALVFPLDLVNNCRPVRDILLECLWLHGCNVDKRNEPHTTFASKDKHAKLKKSYEIKVGERAGEQTSSVGIVEEAPEAVIFCMNCVSLRRINNMEDSVVDFRMKVIVANDSSGNPHEVVLVKVLHPTK